ncbi:hypothetical protein T440DRAFT_511196 [Plenodomus tracheiphilus IPT5]|uniref:BTB domain-containing protein n=1 Tax=Plenodomus tracheiphilus IPT5 TaxID=1408161 RepID=A0A6A7ARW2_9PLEO|nr:hypothetical protein T440DRAFT_511196 [Plenodomus tracheiphilus IPT5]
MSTFGTIPVVFGKIAAPAPPAGSPLGQEREKMKDCRIEESGAVMFPVHQSLLCSRSELFKSLFENVGGPSHILKEEALCLPERQPEDFRRYLNLIYANQLVTKGPGEWEKLCRLYLLAEKMQDRAAKNTVVDGMHTFLFELVSDLSSTVDITKILPPEATERLYNGTASGCQVRRLIVDVYADCGHESWLREGREHLPTDLVYNVAVQLMQQRSTKVYGSSINRPASWYHEQISGREKEARVVTPPITPPRTVSNKTDTDTAKRSYTKPRPRRTTPKRAHQLPVTPPPSTGKTLTTEEGAMPKLHTLSLQATTPTREPQKTPRSSLFDITWKKPESTDPVGKFGNTKPPAPSVKDIDQVMS